ncbi:MAG: 8-amino-7-oxononanoate synthase [Aquificota bacterium]|nr:8-amino-7-oxononanoate synthase [Aquificota bacterium]
MDWARKVLSELRSSDLYRKRVLREGVLDFCSNDYLGLRDHPEVVEEAVKALRDTGLGSGASQLVSGYTRYHRNLEERLAEFKGVQRCVLFGSGYLANVGTIPALAEEGDLILSDELNHASIIDGCRLSRARKVIFPHRDYERLREILRKERGNYNKVLIISDSVFSMDGDTADVRKLLSIAEEFDCLLYLDEAHATGTLGRGRGILEEFGLRWTERIILMGTLSKALGSYGAFVCGSGDLVDLIVNRARSLIFTTSLPPSLCAGALKAVDIVEKNPELVRRLKERSIHIRRRLSELPLEVPFHGTPIIPIMVWDEGKALRMAEGLLRSGILLQAIRYPTVPKGKARLRLTVSLRYRDEDVDLLLDRLGELI